MEFKYSKNIKYLILALGGIVLMFLSFLIHIINPMEVIINKLMTLSEGSFVLNVWSKPPYEVLLKMYVFNVTNSEAFLDGTEKLRFQEVGPYVYQELLTNVDVRFNENNTMTATQIRNLIPRPDLSNGNLDNDTIISPNLPLLAISSVLSEFGWFFSLAPSKIIDGMGINEFIKLSIPEYLWGYNDPLVRLANTFVPGWIDFSKFGIFDRLFAVDNASNVVTILLGENTSIQTEGDFENIIKRLPYSVHRFNGSPGLKQWGYKENVPESKKGCNTVEGAFDGGLFPRDLKENTSLHFYRRAFCRSVPMSYKGKGYSNGFEVYNYRVDKNFLDRKEDNPENECYCRTKKCLPTGFGDIGPCYYTFPIAISLPHYLHADPKIAEQVEGLYPDEEKHDTILKVNPKLGIPVKANLRIQINLKVSDTLYTKKSKPFKGMMVPLFWIELEIRDIPYPLKTYVTWAVNNGPIAVEVLKWSVGLLGMSMVAVAALIIFFFPAEHRLEDPYGNRIGYSPILVLPIPQHFKPDLRISK